MGGYGGCHRCGSHGHRAVECDATIEDWMVKMVHVHGVFKAKIMVVQMMAKAEVKAASEAEQQQEQPSWSQVVREGGGAQRGQLGEEAKGRYAQQRRVRQARKAAQAARQNMTAAQEAVQRGEYPAPWATVAVARAKRKEAEANRREAMHRQEMAQRVRHEEVQRQSREEQSRQQARASGMIRGIARHREEEAAVQARSAEMQIDRARAEEQEAQRQLAAQCRKVSAPPWAELKRQAAAAEAAVKAKEQAKQHMPCEPSYPAWDAKPDVGHRKVKKRVKNSGFIPLQPDVNMIDISLNSPCLRIPCLANQCLTEQA